MLLKNIENEKKNKILEVNYADICGKAFDGYDLMNDLNERGFHVSQVVLNKCSDSKNVHTVGRDIVVHSQLRYLERKYSVSNVLFPYGEAICDMNVYREAELVHFHILHNEFISLLDYPRLMNGKPSVWTIHDPWILTGNCLHPLFCDNWKNGCYQCNGNGLYCYTMSQNNTHFMWKLKRHILSQINPDIIVSCSFMEKYLRESPLTAHFNRIHLIPFGVDLYQYNVTKEEGKHYYQLDVDRITLGFRVEEGFLKGCSYIFEALTKLNMGNKVDLVICGNGEVPDVIKKQYFVRELGWISDDEERALFFAACDIFLMPSLAESFGMMAIEAMAAKCAVIVFEGTVLQDITQAPRCGIAAKYASSDSIAEILGGLIYDTASIKVRGMMGREIVQRQYTKERYLKEHEKLYVSLIEEVEKRGECQIERKKNVSGINI